MRGVSTKAVRPPGRARAGAPLGAAAVSAAQPPGLGAPGGAHVAAAPRAGERSGWSGEGREGWGGGVFGGPNSGETNPLLFATCSGKSSKGRFFFFLVTRGRR